MNRTFALLLLAVALAPPALGHSHKHKALEIVHPWTPAMVEANITDITVFMTIKNGSNAVERLLSAATPLAEKVELIELQSHGSMTLPAPVSAFRIPAGDKLELNVNGPRLLLSGFKKRLNAYDSFNLTLVFEKAGRMVVEVMVEEAETTQPHKH